jgi:hypothetical protein
MTPDQILLGPCEEHLKALPDNSVDALIFDPPYGLGTKEPTGEDIIKYLAGQGGLDHGGDFMGKSWDIPSVPIWRELYRVLKPGGYCASFGGTRTWDLIQAGALAGGFQPVEGHALKAWNYSSGFPKSLNVSAKIDELLGEKREVIGIKRGVGGQNLNDIVNGRDEIRDTSEAGGKGVGAYGTGAKQVAIDIPVTAPKSPEAIKYSGWGTSLKPAWEPVMIFSKGTPAFPLEMPDFFYCGKASRREYTVNGAIENDHVSKKPLKVMRWLVQHLSKPGGLVLDPYVGSGTTACAAYLEGRQYLGIERDPHYHEVACSRVEATKAQNPPAGPTVLDFLSDLE